jgi:glycine/serine hydroxymethyltransferase
MNRITTGRALTHLKRAGTESDRRPFQVLTGHRDFMRGSLPTIASESIVDPQVVAAQFYGEELTDAEVIEVETLAQERCKHAFDRDGKCDLYADISAPSGAAVNLMFYARAIAQCEDKSLRILAGDLKKGFAHLSHGAAEEIINLGAIMRKPDRHSLEPLLLNYGFEHESKETDDTDYDDIYFLMEFTDDKERTITDLKKEFPPEWIDKTVQVKNFLQNLYDNDRQTYRALEYDVKKLAHDEDLPDLLKILRGGNPTAVNQNHEVTGYQADPETGLIDYDAIAEQVLNAEQAVDMVILGGSANPRDVEFEAIVAAAKERGTIVVYDCAHYTGLITGGQMKNPLDYGVDVVLSTTHKSPRGPKGGMFLANKESLQKKAETNPRAASILETLGDKEFNFDIEGHQAAAQATMWHKMASKENEEFAKQVIENAKALAEAFDNFGWKVVTGGTDSHIVLIDVKASTGLNGDQIAKLCERFHIITNKNGVPGDTGSAIKPDGVRFGTVALTQMGAKPEDMYDLADAVVKLGASLALENREPSEDPDTSAERKKFIITLQQEVSNHVNEVLKRTEHPDQSIEILADTLKQNDPKLYDLLKTKIERGVIGRRQLIRYFIVTCLQTKYAEGQADENKKEDCDEAEGRYYEGNKYVDMLERYLEEIYLELAGDITRYTTSGSYKLEVNTQLPSPDMALLATLRGIAVSGEKIALPNKPGLWTGLIDSEFIVSEVNSEFIRSKLTEYERNHETNFFGDNRVVVISSDWDLKAPEWRVIAEKAKEEDVVLVAESIGDFGRLVASNDNYYDLPFNPLQHEFVDIMLINTEDIGGPKNSTAIISDPKKYKKLRPPHQKTLSGSVDSMVFPATIGGGDLVAMAEAAIALAAYRYKNYRNQTEPGKLL